MRWRHRNEPRCGAWVLENAAPGPWGTVTNGPTYYSDEELIKRLQAVMRDAPEHRSGDDAALTEARSLAAELAERIYADPATWGVSSIPADFRDDAVTDAFVALLYAIPELHGRQRVAEWFNVTIESRFRRLWTLSQGQAAERERLAAERPAIQPSDEVEGEEQPESGAPSVFEVKDGVWEHFEHGFPRDAFALRLRYLLKRTPDEMAVMLDAPSARAINMRLSRARDRFRMFCEQSGVSRRETANIMGQLTEEPGT